MTNLGIKILFWIILIIYFGIRITETRKAFNQQYKYGLISVNSSALTKQGKARAASSRSSKCFIYLVFIFFVILR